MDEENVVCTYSKVLFKLKKKETLPVLATWMDLEDIILNEISQIQKDKCFTRPRRRGSPSHPVHRSRKQHGAPGAEGREGGVRV